MVSERVFAVRIKPQSPGARRHEAGIRYRISAGEQGDVLTQTDELFCEPGHNPLGSSIQTRRNALVKRCDLSDSHSLQNGVLASECIPETRTEDPLTENRIMWRSGLSG